MSSSEREHEHQYKFKEYFNDRLNTELTNGTATTKKEYNDRLNMSEWRNGTVPATKEYYFNNWMTLLSQLPLLLFTLLNSILYSRISEKVRIAGSQVFILILFILTAILVKVPMEQDSFFSITMATIWFINLMQGSLFGLVGLLPQKYSSVFMSGQGLAGTFAALAMLFAIASETDEETAALGYFVTPCVGTLVTLFSYLLLSKLEFARFHLTKGIQENGDLNSQATDSVPNGSPSSLESDGAKQAFVSTDTESNAKKAKSSVWEVFKKISVMAFCVTFVFTVTLSVFPAVTVDVKTAYPGKWEKYFIPVCCFLLFNMMDLIGRSVTSWLQWPSKESRLFPALVISRVIFIPLLMFCNVQERRFLPVLFTSDWWFVVIMMLFSLSSGYCVCLSMSYAPQLVAPQDAETAGALMTFFLALGLSLGAVLSFLLRFIV
ncbi:Equilibrative nucleoside transporter 2 [Bagarius yarrelli]|uniref:Equilibrative nucleoside transporter 2 n=1 Tax=Bagarius yarrelli TaxID=175774 RepID=A0A556TZW2_BAGYA|nr:Equilibrative nucleoside transporter 2 [Bagarius yarrelli]